MAKSTSIREILSDRSQVLKNIQDNSEHLLYLWSPRTANIVDRSETLKQVYDHIKFVTEYSNPSDRKPFIGLCGSFGSGKTLLLAMAANKIAPVTSDSNGKSSKDILDLGKRLDLDYLPIYLVCYDKVVDSHLGAEAMVANRILYWLCCKNREICCYYFVKDYILDKDVPSIGEILDYLLTFNKPLVYFIDEVQKMQYVGISPAESISCLISEHHYDDAKVAVLASSSFSKEFTEVCTRRGRNSIYVGMQIVTSVDSLISPFLKHNAQLAEFFANEENYKMMKLILLNCIGSPELMRCALRYLENYIDELKDLSRVAVYEKFKQELQSQFRENDIPVKAVAAAFCQVGYDGMGKDLEEFLDSFLPISIIGNRNKDHDVTFPLISPICMRWICRWKIPNGYSLRDPQEYDCASYLYTLLKFMEDWTKSLLENSANSERKFAEYLALWWRAYLECLKVVGCESLRFSSLFDSKAIGYEPSGYINLHSTARFIEGNDYEKLEGKRLAAFVKTREKNKDRSFMLYQNGELIVMFKEECDFAHRLKTNDGYFDALFVTKFMNLKEDGSKPDWQDLADHYKKLPKAILDGTKGKHLMVFITNHKLDPSGRPEDLPLVAISKETILRLAGPSLGFVIPAQVYPDSSITSGFVTMPNHN